MRVNHWLQVLPVLTSLQDGRLPYTVSQTNPFLLKLFLPGHSIPTAETDTKLGASYKTKGDASLNQLQNIHKEKSQIHLREILPVKELKIKEALLNDEKENKLTIKRKIKW